MHAEVGNPMDGNRCTATSRSGERCKRAAATGHTVCVMHGAKSPSGSASPHFVHGRACRKYPARFRRAIRRALRQSATLAEDLAALDAAITDVVAGSADPMTADQARALADLLQVRWRIKEAAARRDLHLVRRGDFVRHGDMRQVVGCVATAIHRCVKDGAVIVAIRDEFRRVSGWRGRDLWPNGDGQHEQQQPERLDPDGPGFQPVVR